jgi:hypothetical protein
MNNYNLIDNVTNPELIFFRFIILMYMFDSFENKELCLSIIERDFYLLFLLYVYNKWNTNTWIVTTNPVNYTPQWTLENVTD